MPKNEGTILFVTTGVVLKYIQNDPALSGFSHLIIDEVHERDHFTDVTMGILKQVIK